MEQEQWARPGLQIQELEAVLLLHLMVQAAQEEGAVLTKVAEKRPNFGTWIKNRAALGEWVAGQGWSKVDITRVVNDAGYADSNAYLGDLGNTVQSLAELLYEALGGE